MIQYYEWSGDVSASLIGPWHMLSQASRTDYNPLRITLRFRVRSRREIGGLTEERLIVLCSPDSSKGKDHWSGFCKVLMAPTTYNLTIAVVL